MFRRRQPRGRALPGKTRRPQRAELVLQHRDISSGGLRFAGGNEAARQEKPAGADGSGSPSLNSKLKTLNAPKRVKNDPKLVAAVRELRDRYLEEFNRAEDGELTADAKYDVGRRQLAGRPKKSRLLMNPRAA